MAWFLCSGSIDDVLCAGTPRYPLLELIPPAIPLFGYPSPFMPLLWKVGYMGVGIRPVALVAESRPKRSGLSFAGRKLVVIKGESGG
jgi:hypothetical protein